MDIKLQVKMLRDAAMRLFAPSPIIDGKKPSNPQTFGKSPSYTKKGPGRRHIDGPGK